MEKVNKEVALKEVTKWLDHKKIDEKKREESEVQIETIVDAIVAGNLSLNKEFVFTHTLKFEILAESDGSVVAKEFKYKPRLKMAEIEAKMVNVDSSNSFGLIAAYVAALSGQSAAILKLMDTEDNKIAQAIAMFFL